MRKCIRRHTQEKRSTIRNAVVHKVRAHCPERWEGNYVVYFGETFEFHNDSPHVLVACVADGFLCFIAHTKPLLTQAQGAVIMNPIRGLQEENQSTKMQRGSSGI